MPRRLFLLLLLGCACAAAPAAAGEAPLQLGYSTVALNGPWRFHTGDDLQWADPAFDDSGWERVDLTAPAGARDDDVGLTGFVPGWAARGHAGYVGYAWYRLRIAVRPPVGRVLALAAPFVVDSAYQVYANGQLLGGLGDFRGAVPTAYGFHHPRVLALPPDLARGGTMLLAVRTWMGPWNASDPVGGGIHIAPLIGERAAVIDHYRLQWLEVVEGYIVDAVEGLLFLFLAVAVVALRPFDRANRAYGWMAAALLLLAVVRGNQAFLFWWQFETIRDFELYIATLAIPLSLGVWVVAWNTWFGRSSGRLTSVAATLTVVLMAAQFFSRSWFAGVLTHRAAGALDDVTVAVRLAFLAIFAAVIVRGVRASQRDGGFALAAAGFLAVGLFARELSSIAVPGIWFPFGIGVSRTEYAYFCFDVALAVLLLRRLYSFSGPLAPGRLAIARQPEPGGS